MLIQFNKKFLLSSTVIAGFTAMAAAGTPAFAQDPTPAPAVTPQAQGAPPQAGQDPAMVSPNADDENEVDSPQEEAAEEEGDVEAVVVTGSRIRRNPTNAPTPLIQLNREEILQSGEANIVDFLADIPALQGSTVPEDTTGAGLGDGGLSLLNLRNLGSQRTLVLVDTRRHVGANPGTSSVDVDSIPSLLIEDVEIITGGASAQYGADAVSGVVNFILRRNFEGVELDGVFAEINQGGGYNRRVSGLVGKNFLNDRLNVYAFGEYQKSDEVLDSELDYINSRGEILFQNDLDPNAITPDGVLDVLPGRGFGSVSRIPGGVLTLANSLRPTPLNDPDIPAVQCDLATNSFPGSCFTIDPPFSFAFNPTGGSRLLNFGTFRPSAGQNRTNLVGGDSQPLTAFQNSRLPFNEAYRFQTGVNFDLTDEIQIFGEYKYVEEQTVDNFQPAFFNIGLTPVQNGRAPTFSALNAFSIGTDNAFLDPNLRAAILANRRTTFDLRATVGGVPNPNFGQPTGTVLDQRAVLLNFTPELGQRPQDNTRETNRFVVGLRGDRDQIAFIQNVQYEASYTYGEVEDENVEPGTVDAERYAYAADAVVDATNVTGRGAGAIVCRVQLLAARDGSVSIPTLGLRLTATDPAVRDCVPIRIFGEGGVSDAARAYINTSQLTTNRNEQQDFVAFASGEAFDIFGAGPIGVAAGYEYREEKASGTFVREDESRTLLFANDLADFEEATFDVNEVFGEIRVPIFDNAPFADNLEVTGSFRRSDYSTFGESDTYGVSVNYKPIRDILLRATYGKSQRTPNLSELFSPIAQTFAQLTDPCSATVIATTADPRVRANRIRNCALLGIPTTFVDPNPTSSNAGRSGGNEELTPEESDSYTYGVVLTPRFARGLSIVADYYDIKISNVIAQVTAQVVVNACTDNDTLNQAACDVIGRGADFEINDFLEGPVNFAALRARGIDFAVRYGLELEDLDFIGRDIGRLDFNLRGNYLIRRQNFTNITSPGQATEIDSTINSPRVRFRLGTTYSQGRFGVTHNMDYQSSQEILDARVLLNDVDNRPAELLTTDRFIQHDFSARYEVTDNVLLRAGVVNAFDAEPNVQTGVADNFDLFGRRFFVGLNLKLGAASDRR